LTYPRLTTRFKSLKKLYERHDFVKLVGNVLIEEIPGLLMRDVDAKIEWLASTFDDLLAASNVLEADDARALFQLLDAPWSPNNYLNR
jgi:hypothetical protein